MATITIRDLLDPFPTTPFVQGELVEFFRERYCILGGNSDTFRWLMATSDPYMSDRRRRESKKKPRGRKPNVKVDKRTCQRKKYVYTELFPDQ